MSLSYLLSLMYLASLHNRIDGALSTVRVTTSPAGGSARSRKTGRPTSSLAWAARRRARATFRTLALRVGHIRFRCYPNVKGVDNVSG